MKHRTNVPAVRPKEPHPIHKNIANARAREKPIELHEAKQTPAEMAKMAVTALAHKLSQSFTVLLPNVDEITASVQGKEPGAELLKRLDSVSKLSLNYSYALAQGNNFRAFGLDPLTLCGNEKEIVIEVVNKIYEKTMPAVQDTRAWLVKLQNSTGNQKTEAKITLSISVCDEIIQFLQKTRSKAENGTYGRVHYIDNIHMYDF